MSSFTYALASSHLGPNPMGVDVGALLWSAREELSISLEGHRRELWCSHLHHDILLLAAVTFSGIDSIISELLETWLALI